jgi:hypothetical protein
LKRTVTGVLMLLSATFAAHVCAQTTPPAGAADRAYTVQVLARIAGPVLDALMHAWEQDREAWTHYEAFARTLAGVAPWLELGPDDSPEG